MALKDFCSSVVLTVTDSTFISSVFCALSKFLGLSSSFVEVQISEMTWLAKKELVKICKELLLLRKELMCYIADMRCSTDL